MENQGISQNGPANFGTFSRKKSENPARSWEAVPSGEPALISLGSGGSFGLGNRDDLPITGEESRPTNTGASFTVGHDSPITGGANQNSGPATGSTKVSLGHDSEVPDALPPRNPSTQDLLNSFPIGGPSFSPYRPQWSTPEEEAEKINQQQQRRAAQGQPGQGSALSALLNAVRSKSGKEVYQTEAKFHQAQVNRAIMAQQSALESVVSHPGFSNDPQQFQSLLKNDKDFSQKYEKLQTCCKDLMETSYDFVEKSRKNPEMKNLSDKLANNVQGALDSAEKAIPDKQFGEKIKEMAKRIAEFIASIFGKDAGASMS